MNLQIFNLLLLSKVVFPNFDIFHIRAAQICLVLYLLPDQLLQSILACSRLLEFHDNNFQYFQYLIFWELCDGEEDVAQYPKVVKKISAFARISQMTHHFSQLTKCQQPTLQFAVLQLPNMSFFVMFDCMT